MSDAGACEPLMELLLEQLRSGPKLQIDETTVQVLKEPVPRLRAAARLETPVLGASRGGWVATDIIGDHQGYVQTDGNEGYARRPASGIP